MNMATLEILGTLLLAGVMGAAVWHDARWRRIPNEVTVTGAAAGLVLAGCSGLGAFGSSAAALGLCVVLGVPLFATGVLGGGDVKLLGAAGAFLGVQLLPLALALTAGSGLLLGTAVAVRAGRLTATLVGCREILLSVTTLGRAPVSAPTAQGSLTIPYAIPIAIGALGAWALRWL